MERKIYQKLNQWKESKYRKPLILQGPRQVGKTYALLSFGRKEYEQVAYFNFQTDPNLQETFLENIHPDYLIPLLSRISKVSITKGNTLIIFDEVQLCERALTSLKYFCEEAPEYHIAAAGSLLGVAVNRQQYSFPVGKVDILNLHPMDFEEFLMAMNERELIDDIRSAFATNEPLPAVLHDTAENLYRQYLLVGGMPECVEKYVDTRDFLLIRHTQDAILTGYMSDMSKYNKTTEIHKTNLVYNSLVVQLSRKNTRFQYKLVKKGGRASELENAIEWLVLSGIVERIFKTEQGKKPLENYKNIDDFKIYMSDIGLLSAKMNLIPNDVLFMTADIDEFKGGLTENYVNQQLTASGYTPFFWTGEKNNEVDFVIQREGVVLPIEVKAGDHVRSTSLNVFAKRYGIEHSIRISSKNFGYEDGKKLIPHYAMFCLSDS